MVHAIRFRVGPGNFNGDGDEILSERNLVVMRANPGTIRRLEEALSVLPKVMRVIGGLCRLDKAVCNW